MKVVIETGLDEVVRVNQNKYATNMSGGDYESYCKSFRLEPNSRIELDLGEGENVTISQHIEANLAAVGDCGSSF